MVSCHASQRQPNPEHSPSAGAIQRLDSSTVRLGNRLADRETQTRSPSAVRSAAVKLLENTLLLLWSETGAAVAHLQRDRNCGRIRRDFERSSLRGGLDRVLQQVHQ